MRAARLHEYDEHLNVQLQLEEVPPPQITKPGEVIVRIGAAGLCRTDLHIIEGVWKDIQDSTTNFAALHSRSRECRVGRGSWSWCDLGQSR